MSLFYYHAMNLLFVMAFEKHISVLLCRPTVANEIISASIFCGPNWS